MNLRDRITLDTQRVFLNPKEFATPHLINDRAIMAVVEDDTEGQHITNAEVPSHAEGIFVRRVVIAVDPIELGFRPVTDGWLSYDGAKMRVAGCSDEDGLYLVTLEANLG